MSVSYTHLDVYKRQDLGCVFAKGVAAVGDIQGSPALDAANALGAALK